MSTSDPNFHIGAYYYLTIQSTQAKVTGKIQLTQRNRFTRVGDQVARKDSFYSDSDLVKFYVYEFPYSEEEEDYEVQLQFESASEEFFPLVLVNHWSQATRATDFSHSQFPTINDYERIYGNEVVSQIDMRELSYTVDIANQQYGYLFVTVYNFVYGLTDQKKPTFYLTISSDNPVGSYSPEWDTLISSSFLL